MENYEDAAESRFEDLDTLIKGKRKVGAIHFGGIYIECLLKGMICMKYTVMDSFTPGKWIVDGQERTRPSHTLCSDELKILLDTLFDDMPDNVENALKYLNRPQGTNYINYRYIPDEEIEKEIYDQWEEHFISVFNYLEQKKHEL